MVDEAGPSRTGAPGTEGATTSDPPTRTNPPHASDHDAKPGVESDGVDAQMTDAPAQDASGSDPQVGTQPEDNSSVSDPASSVVGNSIGLSVDLDDDADSALGDVWNANSSMSATSSIFDFVEIHGRTFHKYKEGKYLLPNDEQEQERLDLQHQIAVILFKGRLALCPVDKPSRVLDIGTGTGIWAVEYADEHPESDVLGTDLSPIQPTYIPPNCRFEVDDCEDDWVYSQKFDYIHARYMVGGIGNFPKVFRSAFENLNSGGYLEMQDYIAKLESIDGTLDGTALQKWNNLLLEGVAKIGKNGLNPLSYKRWMREVGFVEVTEIKYKLPGNAWAKGKEMKLLGDMQMQNILDGIHGMSIALFTKLHGMTVEEVELLLVDVRKDLRNKNIHFFYHVWAVYGKKP